MKPTPLSRRAPLTRKSSMLAPGSVPPVIHNPRRDGGSRPRAGRPAGGESGRNNIAAAVRAAVYERDGMRCVRCGVSVAHGSRSIHHRQPRGMGGTRDPRAHRLSLLVLVCGSGTTGCHGSIESWRSRATTLGWLISQFEAADPQTIPLHLDGELVWLLDDGTKIVERAA